MQPRRSRFRRITITASAIIPTLALAACGSGSSKVGGKTSATNTPASSSAANAGATGSPYKIALISDLSGPYSGVSGPGATGAQVAVNNINANNGVNGRKLNLEVIDSQSSPTAALAAAQKAVSENPLAVIMFSGSAGASSITSLVQSAHVPFLSPALADSSVYPAQPYLYQPSLTAKQDAQALYQFVKLKEGGALTGKTIDIAAISSPYVDVIINNVRGLLSGDGAKIASTQRYQLPLVSFATQAGAIGRDKPDVVLTLGSTDDTVVVSKALRAGGVTALQVGIPSGAGQATLQQIASTNYYALTANPYPGSLPDFISIADRYGKKTDVSGSIFSMSGWVTAYVIAEALRLCGPTCDSAQLNSALEHVSNFAVPDGVSYGPAAFSGANHVAVSTVRFHNYDPATGKFAESDPITVQ
jgi:branched-chain amino acid transport system substrate-binding protein